MDAAERKTDRIVRVLESEEEGILERWEEGGREDSSTPRKERVRREEEGARTRAR